MSSFYRLFHTLFWAHHRTSTPANEQLERNTLFVCDMDLYICFLIFLVYQCLFYFVDWCVRDGHFLKVNYTRYVSFGNFWTNEFQSSLKCFQYLHLIYLMCIVDGYKAQPIVRTSKYSFYFTCSNFRFISIKSCKPFHLNIKSNRKESHTIFEQFT